MKIKIVIFNIITVFILTGCGSDIDIVKNGVMEEYPSLTVGNAMDNWKECDRKEWEEYETENGERVVRFVCYRDDMSTFNKVNNFIKSKTSFEELYKLSVINMEEEQPSLLRTEKYGKVLGFYLQLKSYDELYKFNKDKIFDINSIVSEFQWTINVDGTFELTFAETVYTWKDGKILSSGHSDTLIEDIYSNVYTLDIEQMKKDEVVRGFNDSQYFMALLAIFSPLYIYAK